MKIQYTDYVDVLYVPEAIKSRLADLQAHETGDTKRPYRIDVSNHVRNRDGYRTSLQKDILSLRRFGAIIEAVPTKEGEKLIKEGKIDPVSHATIKPSGVTLPGPHAKAAAKSQ